MILTTPTKQPYTTTKHNNKSYIFTLYLFMFLCVVGNCLLFYCSCTGNCENCCGINGNVSVSGSIKYKIEIKIGNKNKLKEVDISNDGKIGNIQILHKAFVNGEYKASVDVSRYIGNTEKDYNEAAKEEFLNRINNR